MCTTRLARCDRALLRLETVCAICGGFVLITLVVASFLNVVGRSAFNNPLNAYFDIMAQSVPIIAFLGLSYCQRLGGHIRMDVLLGLLPIRARWCAECLSTLLISITVLVLLYGAYLHTERAFLYGDSTEDAGLPLWPVKGLIVCMFTTLALRLSLQLYDYVRLILHPTATPIVVSGLASTEQKAAEEIEAQS